MNKYINIGIPNLGNGFQNIDPLSQMNKIAPKRFYAPGSSPLDKAKSKVKQATDRYNQREEESRRYKQFIEDQKQANDEIRERKKKDWQEVDKQLREEEEEKRKKRKEAEAKLKEEEEADFNNWIDQLAEYGEGQLGKNAKIVKNLKPEDRDRSVQYRALKEGWMLNNMVGNLITTSYDTHLTGLSGKINLNELKIASADAHNQMLEYQRNLDAINQQKQLLMDVMSQPNYSQDDYNQAKQQIDEYNAQINDINQKMSNRQLKQLDEEYKLDFIKNHGGSANMFFNGALNTLKSLFANTENERERYTKDLRNQTLAKYDTYLNKAMVDDKFYNSRNEDGQLNHNALKQTIENSKLERSLGDKDYIALQKAKTLDFDKKASDDYKARLAYDNQVIRKEYKAYSNKLDKSQDYWKIADSYKKGEQLYQGNSLFSKDYWLYAAPGMIGSSNSSPEQRRANLLQYGTLAAGVALSLVPGMQSAGAYLTNAGVLGSIPDQITGGLEENYGEINERKIESLKNSINAAIGFGGNPTLSKALIDLKNQSVRYWRNQGMSWDLIKQRYDSGNETDINHILSDYTNGFTHSNNPELRKADLDSGKGLKAQFMADNVRTMGEMPVQIMMSLMPTKWVRGAGEITQGVKDATSTGAKNLLKKGAQKLSDKLGTDSKTGKIISNLFNPKSTGKVVEEGGKYANGFRRTATKFKDAVKQAYNIGEDVGEALGYGYFGKRVVGAKAAALGGALHMGAKIIDPDAIVTAKMIAENALNTYQRLYDKLLPKDWMRIVAAYGMNAARRGMVQAMSEGAEEGVQYLNSNEDFAKKYGYSDASLGDLIINDYVQGGRIKDAYLSLLGIGNSPLDTDFEFWQNVKGGFALGGMGGLHPGQLINVYGNVKNAVDQYRTNQIIANSAVLNREVDKKDRAANFTFAKLAMQDREAEVANRLQELHDNDRRRETPEFSQEDYDEKGRDAASVMALTKNKHIKGQLEAKGIKYGTDEYAAAIADIYNLQKQELANGRQSKEVASQLNQLYESKEFNDKVDEVVSSIRQEYGVEDFIQNKAREAGQKAVDEAIESAKKEGKNLDGAENVIELQKIRKDAEDKAREEAVQRLKDNVKYRSQLVTNLKALLKFKAQQNSAKDFFDLLSNKLNLKTFRPDAKTIMDSTIKQIDTLKQELIKMSPEGIDLGKTDADLLKALDEMEYSVASDENAEQLALNQSVLMADAAVTQKYLNQFQYGIVKNKDGKFEYNPKQYEKELDKIKRQTEALKQKDKEKGKAEAEKISKEDVTQPYDEKEVENNVYKNRVQKILETHAENEKLNWMAADAYEGDLITKYTEQLEKEAEEAKKKEEQENKKTKNSEEKSKPVQIDPKLDSAENKQESKRSKWERNKRSRKAKFARNREVYEERKAKAESILKKIKHNIKKNTSGKAYSSIIPLSPKVLGQIASAAASLMEKAALGVYKIGELVQDLKECIKDVELNIDIDQHLDEIKKLYIKYKAQYTLLGIDDKNFSDLLEISTYNVEDASEDFNPPVQINSQLQTQLNNDAQNIINSISNHQHVFVQTENGVVICNNEESIGYLNDQQKQFSSVIEKEISQHNSSDVDFKNCLMRLAQTYSPVKKIPVDDFVKYRNVNGIYKTIGDYFATLQPNRYIIDGSRVRSGVIGALFNDDYLLNKVNNLIGYDKFVEDVNKIGNNLKLQGYTIVKTNNILFDPQTQQAIQADIIAVNDNTGDVIIIDVLSSYTDINSRWFLSPGGSAKYTIVEREQKILKTIQDVLKTRFGITVKAAYTLPVTIDNGEIHVQNTSLIPVFDQNHTYDVIQEIEKLFNVTQKQVEDLNDIIDQYNTLIQCNKLPLQERAREQHASFNTYSEYQTYSASLYDKLQYATEDLNQAEELVELKQTNPKKYQEIYGDPSDKPSTELQELVDDLDNVCKELDVLIGKMPDLKIQTQVEKDVANQLYRCIFQAQRALEKVLRNDEQQQIDVTKEEELIASALETLLQYKDLENLHKLVQKWWLNRFVVGPVVDNKSNSKSVDSIRDQGNSYYRTIKSWIDTLEQYVLNDLHERPVLQDWYDTLLSVYFNKLLDNAQQFIDGNYNNFTHESINQYNNLIQRGKNLIQDFKEQYSIYTDKEYPEPPANKGEELNRIDQQYQYLYNKVTLHYPSFEAMNIHKVYHYMSTRFDFEQNAAVFFSISNRDRTYTGDRFSYKINKGDVMMTVRYYDSENKNWLYAELPLTMSDSYINNPRNDDETKKELRKINNVNKKFEKIVKEALEYISQNKDKELSYTINTNAGKILYAHVDGKIAENKDTKDSIFDFLFGDEHNKHDLFTITLSEENGLGITKYHEDKKTGQVDFYVHTGKDLSQRLYTINGQYTKEATKINNGCIIYLYNTMADKDNPGKTKQIAVPIESDIIGNDDAKKILSLIKSYKKGNDKTPDGYDILELLKQRLYMLKPGQRISLYNNLDNLVELDTDAGKNKIKIGNDIYDLTNIKSEQNLINRLSLLTTNINANTLNDNLMYSNNQIFSTIRNIFKTNKSINEVTLPNGLTFSREDFEHENQDGTYGSTYLGYLLRNRILCTKAVGRGATQLYVDNFKIVDKQNPATQSVEKEVQQTVDQTKQTQRKLSDQLEGLLTYAVSKKPEPNTGASRTLIEQYIEKVFGNLDNLIYDIHNTDLGLTTDNKCILGYCSAHCMNIASNTPMSVVYHESFHRVFELLISDELRDTLYNNYKKKFGNHLSDRQVAEGFADLFTAYMENKDNLNEQYKGLSRILIKPFKQIAYACGFAKRLGIGNTIKLYSIYHNINNGKYKDLQISDEKVKRFEQLFGDKLYYSVTTKGGNSVDYKQLSNSAEVNDAVKGLSYYIIRKLKLDQLNPKGVDLRRPSDIVDILGSEIIDILCGKNIPVLDKTETQKMFAELFEKESIFIKNKQGVIVGEKRDYPKLNGLFDKIKDYLNNLVDKQVEEIDEDSDISEDDYKAMSKNIEQFDKASFETSKIQNLPSNIKYFFATVPYLITTSDGVKLDLTKNKFGLPTFMPMNEVFNLLNSELNTCRSLQEFDTWLYNNKAKREIYGFIYEKFHTLYQAAYTTDENGNTKVADYNAEAYCIGIVNAIRGQKIKFLISTSKKQKDSGREVTVKESSLDRDKYTLTKTWYNSIVSGQISVFSRNRKDGNLIFVKGAFTDLRHNIFADTSNLLKNIQDLSKNDNKKININGTEYNLYNVEDLNSVKDIFINALCKIGINTTKDALNYMLQSKYGGSDLKHFMQMFTDGTNVSKIDTFIDNLNNVVTSSGVNENNLKRLYLKTGFLSELATYTSKHRRLVIESMALGLNGKKLYSVSQNNTVSAIVNDLNTRDRNNARVKTLIQSSYGLMQNGAYSEGSIILEMINANKDFHIGSFTYIGSKTDNKNDNGSEYKEETSPDDYMAKLAMLQAGILIFPTLADKGTWMCLTGVKIPGMTFTKDAYGNVVVQNQPTVVWKKGKPFIRPNDIVLDRMLSYARTERQAIFECMETLGYDNIPGYEKQGLRVLKKSEKIKNYHTNGKVKDENGKTISVEPNGTRFFGLTEIAMLDKDGSPVLNSDGDIVTINLNDPTKSSAEMLSLANKYLFEKHEGETDQQFLNRQRDIMAYTLNVQYQLEVKSAINLGIVERCDVLNGKNVLFSKEDQGFFNLKSDYLNNDQINALSDIIYKSNDRWYKADHIEDKTERLKYQNTARQLSNSLAIAMILSDTTSRSIISVNEITRCFTGNPAFYKVIYAGRYIFDSTYDLQKRLGGIVSTGEDNIDNLVGAKQTYTCAECGDYEVASKADITPELEELFVNGMIKDSYCSYRQKSAEMSAQLDIQEIVKNKNMPRDDKDKAIFDIKKSLNEELERIWQTPLDSYEHLINNEDLDEDLKKVITKAYHKGVQFANSYNEKINVADGEAYITADMCKDLLRRRGALTNDVKKAFDLLESGEKYSWQDKADAFDLIYHKVNLVTTKYTAFGFRPHNQNGEQMSNLAVPYYNKYSLAPLFPCMATGNMKQLYDKMLNEGVDVLLMTSAVKVGSQGAVEYNGKSIDEPFNKYEQDFTFLRRQLNTDPEEETESTLGTQMVKLVMQNLRVYRNDYVDSRTGDNITGQDILNTLMSAINSLTEIGYQKVKDDFGIDNNGNIDYKKLSNYLISELSSRDADKGLLKALQFGKDGKIQCPLSATTSSKWIESILISTINKKIIDILTPGNSFVQRSVFAMEGSKTEGGAIKSDKDITPEINGGERLQMINENGSMDCVISIDYFKSILPEGLSFNEAKQWLIDHKIIGHTGSGVKPQIIGYRIPTQSEASIHSLRVVDVIPAVQATIILPEEFTKVTGSDFDIDHLYLASYNYRTLDDGTITTEFDKSDPEYFQNTILDCMQTLLLDVENSMHCLFKSIDNDTELLTDIAEQFPEYSNIKHHAYNFGTLHEQIERREDYITGKFGIGPFALNVTNQTLCRIFGIKFNRNRFTTETGLINLDLLMDVDGNSIDSWISAFINAHVDIVKDPYISKMNVNKFTYNLVNLLIRTGFGESTMWFIAQPILVELAKSNNKLNSQFLRERGFSKSKFQKKEFERIQNELGFYCKYEPNLDVDQKIGAVKFIKEHKDVLKYIVINRQSIIENKGVFMVGDKQYDLGEVQKTMYHAYQALLPYSNTLGKFVQHTKIDTKKQGKSLIELKQYLIGYNQLFATNQVGNLFDVGSLQNLKNNSWIRSKTEYACNLPFQILNKQCFEANQLYLDCIYDLYNLINIKNDYTSKQAIMEISKQVITQIKSKYFVYYVDKVLKKADEDVNEHIRNLFVGKYSMVSRLNSFIYNTKFNNKYKRLKDNYLLNSLYIGESKNDVVIDVNVVQQVPQFIQINDNADSGLMQDAWLDLMNDNDQNVRNFARDLVVYAFMTSGENVGWNSLYKYVPIEWTLGEVDSNLNNFNSFANFIKDRLENSDFDDYINLDKIVANNYRDYNFVQTVDKKSAKIYGRYCTIPIDIASKRYIKITNGYGKNTQQYQHKIYKIIGYQHENKKIIGAAYKEIHKAGYDSGMKQRVYQYGWNFMYMENLISKDSVPLSHIPGDLQGEDSQPLVERDNKKVQITNSVEDTTDNKILSMSQISMYSGGAYGADTLFDVYARRHGIIDIHHFRDGGNTKLSSTLTQNGVKATVVSEEQINEARENIFNILGLRLGDTLQDRLKIRNYYQVSNSDAVFAIATINDDKKSVSGGTNVAVQLGIKLQKPTHVFDINTEKWYRYDKSQEQFIEEPTPVLTKRFAGVGSRTIQNYSIKDANGKWISSPKYVGAQKAAVCIKAIMDLFNNTEAYINNQKPSNNNQLNVYAGTGDNVIFSNFAERQVKLNNLTFRTPEGAFQYAKLYLGYKHGDISEQDFKQLSSKLQYCDGKTARSIGRSVKLSDETLSRWNQTSYNQLKKIMTESFVQNPAIKDALIATGNTPISHQDKDNGIFSQILTDIRTEFQSLLPPANSTCISQQTFNRDKAENNPTSLYIFTDNTDRNSGRNAVDPNSKYAKKYGKDKHYPTMTQAVLRGLDNAMPISTQRWYNSKNKGVTGRWEDKDFDEFKKVIDAEIQDIMDEWDTGKYQELVVGIGGAFFNSNISNITQLRTPKLYNYLKSKIQMLYNYVENSDVASGKEVHYGSPEEQLRVLNSDNTILTNDEILALKPFTGNDIRPRIAVASEHTDPAFFAKQITDWMDGNVLFEDFNHNPILQEDIDALYFITKHDGLPMKQLLQLNKPKIVHFSITTLGNTKYEPGVMKWQDMIERVGDFIKQGLDPEYVTLRIDPIVPGVTKIKDVEALIKRASELGLKHVRFSVMDYYPTTSQYMEKLGYDYSKYYDKYQFAETSNYKYNTHAKDDIIINIANKILNICKKYNMDLATCAEPVKIEGISKQGCLSVQAVNKMLGTHIADMQNRNNKFRIECTCYGGKTDLLQYNKNCASSCIYCYAHHNSDKMLNYYNEDGTLKDNRFTRTREDNQDTLNMSEKDEKEAEKIKNYCKGGK